ncbi:glycine C-acetyltransferase [Francisella tularensis subsp. novicida]|uniref:glycine C-acetyltransferase n=1 Tax=Francisella tularensis TaxID=263 RepID=UPI000158AC92|nr:glycine C-acetyltransferase [Francisella tularensis]AJI45064.1 2-amino-3-ketobutyrate coenzyme A ligase [Francisella tularensis subsp. novicida F6168]AJJ47523.1 glycine C-acetyltransferase [Francisella tularensis subsp. novicida]APA82678.1 2-amino-3-ketobutyrate coenzyme A ligase [Francisella tularensis subsp. novicida PA10-7858]APC98840.1 glycine C-acetyltransferase [Francisella tularensis subsp. novicida]EDN35970.1 2-amino-3-ketobutyrate coenzyme A ligase [Francisella tularensis subsp. no
MNKDFYTNINSKILEIKQAGTYKSERVIATPQQPIINLENGETLINFCANNYLGFANNPEIVAYAKEHIEECGYGMASVRFICGTNSVHKQLEKELSNFFEFEDTILYPSCFDANAGLFETLLTKDDAIISDSLNHASIIDGVRLCKAMRFRYNNNDMQDLEAKLIEADQAGARFKMIATDGVFSMDGIIADLKSICDLADKYNAIVMVDDSHAAGFVGKHGKGSIEHCDVMGRVDILTGTLGKGLGGASGGYICAKKEVVDLLKNLSRPYLFSNSLAPIIAKTSIKALEITKGSNELREQLQANQQRFRSKMTAAGFDLIPGEHPIIPVMIYDEKKAAEFAEKLLDYGIYVIAFSYPVVPKGKARIRTQMSAAHTFEQIDKAVDGFTKAAKELGIIQ